MTHASWVSTSSNWKCCSRGTILTSPCLPFRQHRFAPSSQSLPTPVAARAESLHSSLNTSRSVRLDGIIPFMLRTTQFAAIAFIITASAFLPGTLAGQSYPLDSAKGLEPHSVTVEPATYQGRKGIHVVASPDAGG